MKRISSLFDTSEDRAVSPVIGVILMVAITVILAAVIGTFVLDLGQDLQDDEAAPTLAVDAQTHSELDMGQPLAEDTTGDGTIDEEVQSMEFATISHETGDELDTDDIEIQLVDENEIEVANLNATDTHFTYVIGEIGGEVVVLEVDNIDDEFSGGDTLLLNLDTSAVDQDGATLNDLADLEDSTEYTIQIVHEPSGSVVSESDILLPAAD